MCWHVDLCVASPASMAVRAVPAVVMCLYGTILYPLFLGLCYRADAVIVVNQFLGYTLLLNLQLHVV